jgi:hypothetical protein
LNRIVLPPCCIKSPLGEMKIIFHSSLTWWGGRAALTKGLSARALAHP